MVDLSSAPCHGEIFASFQMRFLIFLSLLTLFFWPRGVFGWDFFLFIPGDSVNWGSPIGLAGCGIWNFFNVICWIWAENRGGKHKITVRSRNRISCLYGVGIQDWQGEESGIWDFNAYSLILFAPTGAQGFHHSLPSDPIFCSPFHFSPWQPQVLIFLLDCPSPRLQIHAGVRNLTCNCKQQW